MNIIKDGPNAGVLAQCLLTNIPLGRIATESDIATAITYLSSDASSMITGSSIIIDGGWTAKG